MTAPWTLLLDVDGTLIDSYPGIRAGFLHALDAVGWPRPPEETIRRIPGPPMEESLRALGMTNEQAAEALAHYMSYARGGGWRQATVFAGMPELLARWHGRGLRLATATSKSEPFARAALERFGMLAPLDFLGAAQENGPRRKKTAVIEYVLNHLNITEPDRVVMIGDRSHDILGGQQFGLHTIAVTWGYGTPEEHALAEHRATTPAELERIVDDLP